MGMSASQARFLSLTARKTNVEYEGQQINQQRTALSNESSNYYSQLTSLAVPVPPSSSDYSKISYTFVDGTEKNTVTSLIATKDTKTTGVYMLNYVQEIPANNMVVNGTAIVTKNGEKYTIGNVELQDAFVINEATESESTEEAPVAEDTEETDTEETDTEETDTEETVSTIVVPVTNDSREETVKRFIAAGIPTEVANAYSNDELTNKLKVESQYRAMAAEKYAAEEWMVRYRKNSSTGSYEAILFSKKELENVDYNDKTGASLSGIKQYVFGETTESREIKNASAKVEQDASGRYISIFIYDKYPEDTESGTRYDLTTTTESDEAGYKDAMNQYYYDKAQYDQKVQEINSKIEIIQVQDKNLELKLKQLDTEQNAISTEMDAVKKVISKNVESSFKTFNA